MNARDLMTKDIRTCRTSDTLQTAAMAMSQARCGFLPVVDDDRKPIGAVTDRDICMAAARHESRLADITVGQTMSLDVCCCLDYDSIDEVEHIMETCGLRRLLVLDETGGLVGVITLTDIAREVRREQRGRAPVREVPAEPAIEAVAATSGPRGTRTSV